MNFQRISQLKEIRPLLKEDFNWVGNLHLTKLPTDLATSFGKNYLTRVLYPLYLEQKISLVIESEGCILLSKGETPNYFYSFLYAATKPKSWGKVFDYLFRRKTFYNKDLDSMIEVSFIFSNKGYGSKLLIAALENHKDQGIFAYTDTAGDFYKKHGFSHAGNQRRGGRKLELWVKNKEISYSNN